jgi:hypothetical protein
MFHIKEFTGYQCMKCWGCNLLVESMPSMWKALGAIPAPRREKERWGGLRKRKKREKGKEGKKEKREGRKVGGKEKKK